MITIQKEWKTLLRLLDSGNVFRVGILSVNRTPMDRKAYDANQQLLRSINKKLINFFNRHYPLNLPEEFRFYGLDRKEAPGTYRLRFNQRKEDLESEKEMVSIKFVSDEDLEKEIFWLRGELNRIRKSINEGGRDRSKEDSLVKVKRELQESVEEAKARGISQQITDAIEAG